MKTLIFINGQLEGLEQVQQRVKSVDLIIAVDGGSKHCRQLKLTPDILIGDLDSISKDLLAQYKKDGVIILQFPTRKDATDLELALDLACERKNSKVWLVGALGGRWDMSIGNILLTASEKYKTCWIEIIAQESSMQVLHPGENSLTDVKPGCRVSLLALSGDVTGVSLKGFEYPLSDQTIKFGSSLGVSNIIKKESASISHKDGCLLLICSRG